jgi:hypothetical protein
MTKKEISNQLEKLVGYRFSLETLETKLSEIFNSEVTIEDISDKEDELTDYNLLAAPNNSMYAYVDIYYLKLRRPGHDGSTIYVTEVCVEI